MGKEQHRSARFFLDAEICAEMCKNEMNLLYKDHEPPTSAFDEEWPAHHNELTTDEMINQIHGIVLTARQIANGFGISKNSITSTIKRREEQGDFTRKAGSGRLRIITAAQDNALTGYLR
ncbi:hypothetical protein Trydic_g16370 [Trypoxylus dichotomus]